MFSVMRSSSIDFAFGASGLNIHTQNAYPTGGALLYRWSAATKLLISNWLMEQLLIGVSADDQLPLWKALGYTPMRGGLLDPTLRFLSSLSLSACVLVWFCTRTCVVVYVHVLVLVYVCACVRVRVFVCGCVRVYMCMCVYACVGLSVLLYVYHVLHPLC